MIEVCVDSVESAINAYEGGAHRLEVCSNLVIGGTTPPLALIRGIKNHVPIPLHILIRPRHGDFCYSDYEYEDMLRYIQMLKEESVNGVVIGALCEDGTIDRKRMEEMIQLAKPMYITFHRAFDMLKDPVVALKELIDLSVDCILTSGQKPSAYEGRCLIAELVKASQEQIDIMPGGGINETNYKAIKEFCQVNYMHLSAKEEVPSRMTYRQEGVAMGQTQVSEFYHYRTNKMLVGRVVHLDKKI